MKYLKKITKESKAWLIKNGLSQRLLNKLNLVFQKKNDEKTHEQALYCNYYQLDEPGDVVKTQPRQKVQPWEAYPLGAVDNGGVQGDTKVAQFNLEKSHPPCKWFFNVISGVDQGRQFLAATPEVKIGRKPENHICLKDPKVSRFHAIIRIEGLKLMLVDLGSTNGTFTNDLRISSDQQLFSGDQFKVGDTIIQIKSESW